MRKKIVLTAAVWTAVTFSFLFFSFGRSSARSEPKNYYFPEIRIEINIERDGSFIVDEYRTYDFEGSFSWVSLWIPLSTNRQGYRYDVKIDDFKVLDEQGLPLRMDLSRASGKLTAKWYYQASNQRRTFHIHYRVKRGIFSYPEVSELYWRVIGNAEEKPTRHVSVNVHIPEPVTDINDILVYGHGPLNGKSEIVDRETARFTVDNLRARQYVEIRMVWPAGLVTGVPSNRHTRDSIRQEEARFVQDTIEKAKRAREAAIHSREAAIQSKGRRMRYLYIFFAWLIVAPLSWLPFFIRSWKKVGKDYHFDDIPPYSRELPSDLSPALVEVLLREGRPATPISFTATLFDLARRGYLEMDDRLVEKRRLFGTKQVYETTIICRKDFLNDPELLSYEIEFLYELFVTASEQSPVKGAKFKLKDLKKYLEKNPKTFQKWHKEWVKQIQTESKKLHFIEPASTKMRNIFLAVTLPFAILTLNLTLLILAFILIPKIKRRARHWARENELWRALERFLDDFSSFKDLPPEAYKLWEHFLVFGIIFGNAKKIIKMLPIILKDERAVAPVWYHGFNRAAFISAGRMSSMINSIESMSTSIQHASISAAHYSSGGGGGFSGGGGGGGGGSSAG